MSGLFKRTGSRLDGLLRSAVLADATSEALFAHASSLPTPAEAKPWLEDARSAAQAARQAWAVIFEVVGVRRDKRATQDPLGALTAKFESEAADG